MKILIVGVTGFIGAAISALLCGREHEVIGVSRRPPSSHPPMRHLALDVSQLTTPAGWRPHLGGVDAVVYSAGALQESPGESLAAIHHTAPIALFRACAAAGVRRVIYFSAIGVDRETPTAFSQTKLAGEQALMALDLDWVILRPSIVIGRGAYGGSALLRGLAALPILPLPRNAGALQVVHLDDVVQTVLHFLKPETAARLALDLAGPHPWPLAELVALFRRWLGWRPAITVIMPPWLTALSFRLGDFADKLGWRSAVRSTAGRELLRGATGDPGPWMTATGIRPAALDRAFLCEPAPVQERWFARLYLLRPWLFGALAFFWIATGITSLGPGWAAGISLMGDGGVFGSQAATIVVAGALCDIAVGLAIAWRRTARAGIIAAIVVSIVYGIVGTALVPHLWVDPLGPLLKILPLLALHLTALGVLDDR
jgi:uncharacterized protein YbjT (DUF2867 family)